MLTHTRRRLVHFNVTEHPAEWTARQLLEAYGSEAAPRYLLRDRDKVYGERFSHQAKILGIREAVIAPRSPWQNAYALLGIAAALQSPGAVFEEHALPRLELVRRHLALARD